MKHAIVVRIIVMAELAILSIPVCAGTKHHAKSAPAQGNDLNGSFSLAVNPTKHPFCEETEASKPEASKDNPQASKDDPRKFEREHIHALLKEGVCGIPSAENGTKKGPNWELNLDPFVGEPFWHSGAWNASADWSTVDQKDDAACLAGSADIVMERAFRYGFCDSNKYNVEEKLEATDKTFGLQKADYYIVNIVVWKGDAIKSIYVSKVGGFSLSDAISPGQTIKINDKCQYALPNKSTIDDLLKKINSDSPGCAKADLVNGHLSISSSDGKSAIKVNGDEDQIGQWVNPVTYSVESSFWYVFNHGDHSKLSRQPLPAFANQYPYRIYGTKKPIGLVTIHIRPQNDTWELFRELKAKYTMSISKKTSTPVSDLQGLLGIILNPTAFGVAPETKKDPDGFYGSTFFNAASPSDVTIAGQVDFPNWKPATPSGGGAKPQAHLHRPRRRGVKLPSALEVRLTNREQEYTFTDGEEVNGNNDGGTIYSALSVGITPIPQSKTTGNGAAGNKKSNDNNASTANDSTNTTTSTPTAPTVDCQATSDSNGQESPCKFQSTFNDEDLTHWDVSFGVPFHTLKDLQFNQSTANSSSVVPKTVTRLNAYGFFDIFPVATDIVTPPIIAWPHVMLGLPISGKVFNKPFFGLGDGIYIKKLLNIIPLQFSFYGGVVYNKEFRQIPGTVGAANVQGHRVWSGSYGIEIPVKQFKNMLSSKNSSNNSSNKSGNQKTGSTPQ